MKKQFLRALFAVCALAVYQSTSSAAFESGLLNFDFHAQGPFGPPDFVGTYGPGPGAIGEPDSVWNHGDVGFQSHQSLLNDRGQMTDVGFGWHALGGGGPNAGGQFGALVGQQLFVTRHPTPFAVTGLTANKAYDLYLFGHSTGLNASVAGIPYVTSIYSGPVDALVKNVHYDVHAVVSDNFGTVFIDHDPNMFVGLTALQITPHVPEPAGIAMMLGLGVMLALRRYASH